MGKTERPRDLQQEYKTDGDRLRLIAEAVQDYEGLSDGACRCVVRAILFPGRVDDEMFEWAQEQCERLGLMEMNHDR